MSLVSVMLAESLIRLARAAAGRAPDSSVRFSRTHSDNLANNASFKAFRTSFFTVRNKQIAL